MSRPGKSRELSQLSAVIFAGIAIGMLYVAKAVVVPLALAILFAFLLSPLVTLLERIHLPRMLAVLAAILAAGAVVGSISFTVFRQLVEVTDHMSAYTSNINHKVDALNRTKSTSFTRARDEVERLSRQVGALNWNITDERPHRETNELGASPTRPVSVEEVDKNSRLDTIHGVLGAMVSVFLVVVFTFFMLLQREDLRNRLIRLTGRDHLNLMTHAMDEASQRVSRYLALQLLVNTCYGSIIFFFLYFLALPHALLWGALAGLLRFVPYIGAPIAALLPTAFSLAVFNGWAPTLLILAIFFCMEVVTANFIEPHLYGRQTGLSPLAILVAAVFWTLIWGPIGLILSVPLTVCLVVVGFHVPRLKFLAVLLGDQPVMRPETHYYQRLLASDEQEARQVLETYLKDKSVADLYDQVLIPALSLFEQDRHRNALDKPTVRFITETTRELVEELGMRNDESPSPDAAPRPRSNECSLSSADKNRVSLPIAGMKAVCVAVRDESDEIVALMLAQLLERAGHSVKTIPLGSAERMLEEVLKTHPDVICISALPPYAMSSARGVYSGLRAMEPYQKIILGLWNYAGDPDKAAKIITGQQGNHICTTLAEAVKQVCVSDLTTPTHESSDAVVQAAEA